MPLRIKSKEVYSLSDLKNISVEISPNSNHSWATDDLSNFTPLRISGQNLETFDWWGWGGD